MRKIYSGDTGKEMLMDGSSGFKTDVQVDADGEGGCFISMCWHELRDGLGSVVARIKPDKMDELIKAIQEAREDVDEPSP